MTEAIKERNRLTLAALELTRDKNYHRLPQSEQVHLIKEVLNIGEEVAKWVSAEYGTSDPRALAEKLGVKVFGAEGGQIRGSEYRPGTPGEIVISRKLLDRLHKEVTLPDLSDRILRFVIAHELFHHLEKTRIGLVYKRFAFPGPFWTKWYIKGLSEVAAQSFTQALLGIEISPQVFDYLTYILFTCLRPD